MGISTLDYALVVGYAILSLTLFILLFFEFDDTLIAVGHWAVMLTHIVIIPSIMIDFKRTWFVVILFYSLITSILYHLSHIYLESMESHFVSWDVASQNVLMTSTLALVWYDPRPIPENIYLTIGGLGLFIASLGDVKLSEDVELYELFGGFLMIGLLIYMASLLIYPNVTRNKTYILLGAVAGLIGIGTFVAAGVIETVKYSMCHSIWHISAYVMLYFVLKSIHVPDFKYKKVEQNRSSRSDFRLNDYGFS